MEYVIVFYTHAYFDISLNGFYKLSKFTAINHSTYIAKCDLLIKTGFIQVVYNA